MRTEEDRLRAAIAQQRERLELSQRGLSVSLGWHPATVGKIERGERRITVIELIDLSKALGMEPEKLLATCLAQ